MYDNPSAKPITFIIRKEIKTPNRNAAEKDCVRVLGVIYYLGINYITRVGIVCRVVLGKVKERRIGGTS